MYGQFKQHLQSTIGEIRDAGLCGSEFAVVDDVYKHNRGKTAAWTSASHIEKDPKKKETPTS